MIKSRIQTVFAVLLCMWMAVPVLPMEYGKADDSSFNGVHWKCSYGVSDEYGPNVWNIQHREDPSTYNWKDAARRITVPWIGIGNEIIKLEESQCNSFSIIGTCIVYVYTVDLDGDNLNETITITYDFDGSQSYDFELRVTLEGLTGPISGLVPIWFDVQPGSPHKSLITKYNTATSWEDTHSQEAEYEYSDEENFYERDNKEYLVKVWEATKETTNMELWFPYHAGNYHAHVTGTGVKGFEQLVHYGQSGDYVDDYNDWPSTFQNDEKIDEHGVPPVPGADIGYWQCTSFAVSEEAQAAWFTVILPVDMYYEGTPP